MKLTQYIGASLLFAAACGQGSATQVGTEKQAIETYVSFEGLQTPDAIAELLAVGDDAVLGVLRWDDATDEGVFSIVDADSDLSVQGAARDDQAALADVLVQMFEVHQGVELEAPPVEVSEGEGVTLSAASSPSGALNSVRRTDGRNGGDTCAWRNVTYQARGYALDFDNGRAQIWVHFYAKRLGASRYIGAARASRHMAGLHAAFGYGNNHAFVFNLPEAWDGDQVARGSRGDLRLRAFGINIGGGRNRELLRSNKRYGAYDLSRPSEPHINRCYP